MITAGFFALFYVVMIWVIYEEMRGVVSDGWPRWASAVFWPLALAYAVVDEVWRAVRR